MKILELSSATELGGGEVHLAGLIRELARRGHEILLAVRPNSPLPARVRDLPAAIFELPLRNSLDLFSALRLAQIARRERVDLLHAHLGRDYALAAMAARIARKSALVLTRHHYLPLASNFLNRRLLARVGRFIAVSESVRNALASSLSLESSKIEVIPNWIPEHSGEETHDPCAARSRFQVKAPMTAGMLAKFEPAKGVLEFVQAARLLLDHSCDAEFLIGGMIPARESDFVRKVDDAAGVWKDRLRIRRLGEIANPASFLSMLDVVVAPSWNEAFSLVTLEAMALGKPVIATRCGGPEEIIENGRTGILVAPRDPRAIAEALSALLNDSSKRESLGRDARISVLDRYNRTAVVDRIERLFEEVCRSQAGSSSRLSP